MFESFAFVIIGFVGGISALTGTFPCLMVAMFGDTSKLTVTGAGPVIGGWSQFLQGLETGLGF